MHFLSRRPYGNPSCGDCKGFCTGHYMMPEEQFEKYADETVKKASPPTEALKEMFDSDRQNTEDAAAQVFLHQNEASSCCIYL